MLYILFYNVPFSCKNITAMFWGSKFKMTVWLGMWTSFKSE